MIESQPLHIISEDKLIRCAIMQISENFGSSIIAIDAPLSRPDHGTMRECEKRLRTHGIACFPSGADWVRKWVDKGIALKEWAEKELGSRVIEIYPYAARLELDVGADVKKKTRNGRALIQERLLGSIGGLREMTADILLSDDELDAILSEYTAYLYEKGNACEIDGGDGVIYLPLKKGDHRIDEYSTT